jgi:hypothetical protein
MKIINLLEVATMAAPANNVAAAIAAYDHLTELGVPAGRIVA